MPTAAQARPPIERILARIEVDEYGCWLWPGALVDGYGNVQTGSTATGFRSMLVHRVVWQHYNGLIPDGLQLDHLCRVRHCANPDHLEVVTGRENVRRGQNGARRLMCSNGHWVMGENLYLVTTQKGAVNRQCRECNLASRERSRKTKEAS